MKRRPALWVTLIVVAAVLGLALPEASNAAPARQTGVARVRFVHASFDAPSLNAFADGTLWAAGVRGVAGYFDVASGEHTFSFRLPGSNDDLATVTVTLRDAQRVTIAAVNTIDSLDAIAITDDVSAPAWRAARLKVVHAMPDVGPVTILLDDETLDSGIQYGEVSAETQVFGGAHNLEIVSDDGVMVLRDDNRRLSGDRTYTLFLVGTQESGAFRVVPAESTVLNPPDTSQFRFANMMQGIGPVDVYVNAEPTPLFSGVNFSAVTRYYITGRGMHRVEVYPAGAIPGSTAPLATGSAIVDADQSVIFVAYGNANEPLITAYTSDLSPLPPNSSRLQVINVAVGNPPVQVDTLDGVSLFDHVEVGDNAMRIVPAGTYNLRFSDAESGELMMEKTGFELPPGSATALIAFDDDPADPLVNAVAVSAENVPEQAALRWTHVNIWGPPVDLYLNDEMMVSGLGYKMTTAMTFVEPGRYTMRAYPTGADPSDELPLKETTLDLRSTRAPMSVFLLGPADGIEFVVESDNTALLADGQARVRFINAALDGPTADVQNLVTGAAWVEDLAPATTSVNINFTADTYALAFTSQGETIAVLDATAFEPGRLYTIVLAGVVGQQPGPEAFVVEHTP